MRRPDKGVPSRFLRHRELERQRRKFKPSEGADEARTEMEPISPIAGRKTKPALCRKILSVLVSSVVKSISSVLFTSLGVTRPMRRVQPPNYYLD